MPYECFYTLPKQIERRVIWRIDEQLRSHIEVLSEHFSSESQIAYYLLKQLQQYPEELLLQKHWRSFLFKRCEKVAIAIFHLIPTSSHSCSFSDLFHLGVEIINDPVQFFCHFDERLFNPSYWYPTLKKFTDSKIKYFLFPKVRELTGFTTLGLTNLGLVSRASRKQVIEAIKHSKTQQILSQYLLAWKCFQEVKQSNRLKVNKFQVEEFQKIADRYNQLEERLALPKTAPIDGETIRMWLEEIGAAIRRLLEPQSISIDSQLGEDGTLIDTLSFNPNLEQDLLYKWDIDRVQTALIELINSLLSQIEPLENRQILLLRYGFHLSQCKIAEELNKDQATISRKLKSLPTTILEEISNWIRQNINVETNSEYLDEIKGVLKQYYSEQLDRITIDVIKRLEERKQTILNLFYVTGMTKVEIAQNIELSEVELEEEFDAIAQQLYQYTAEQITTEIELCFQSQAVRDCLPALVESRLPTVLQQLDKN